MQNEDDQECGSCDKLKLRVDYLTKQYGFYTGHMNQVFNFYLVSIALVGGAFVQSMSGPSQLTAGGAQSIAWAGALMSVLFWLLHERSDRIAGVLDAEMKGVEGLIGSTFNTERKASQRKFPFLKNICLFRLTYFGFAFAFMLGACSVDRMRIARQIAPNASPVSVSIHQ